MAGRSASKTSGKTTSRRRSGRASESEGSDTRSDVRRAICGGTKKDGKLCHRGPGQGTDHEGIGRCSIHGGNTETGIKAAGVVIGNGSIMKNGPVMGTPIAMEPVDALLWCVSITAGEVAYLTTLVHQLTEEALIGRPTTETRERGTTGAVNMHGDEGYRDLRSTTYGNKQLHLYIVERQKATDRLAKYAKMALDAGVAERAVALAERQGDILVHVIGQFMKRVGLTEKQMGIAERVLPDLLLELESPAITIGGQ